MRLNRYIANSTDLSRRKADAAIEAGEVRVNRELAHVGMDVTDEDSIVVHGKKVTVSSGAPITVMLNKPVGYVCSKDGQGSPTVYEILPPEMKNLNIAGRLDKDSSGLVLLTSDGDLANKLTHPSSGKTKKYLLSLSSGLTARDLADLSSGIDIGDDRKSHLKVRELPMEKYEVIMQEGRNRQIRRTFESLGYKVTRLRRVSLGQYELDDLKIKQFKIV